PFIEFADDNTFADKKNGRELVKALIPLELQWFTETDISVANDPELLRLMKESGCAQILIGLESPKRSTLDGVEQNANWKFNQADRYTDAIQKNPRRRDHRQRVLRPWPGQRGHNVLRRRLGFRPKKRPVRGPDHGDDRVPRYAPLRSP